MRGFLARGFVTAFGLWMADAVLSGIRFDGVGALWIAAVLLGVVNAVVRPIVVILTLPLTVATLGLFLLVVNGGMLLLVAAIMPSFHIAGWGSAILGAVVVGLTGWAANTFIGGGGRVEIWTVRRRS